MPGGGEPPAPEAVVSVHVSFIDAGADLIETNTFGANRRKLAAHFLEDRVRADQLGGGEAGPRGARGRRPGGASSAARSARSATRATRSRRSSSPSRRGSSRAAAPTSSWSRRSTTSTSSRSRDRRACASVSSLPIVALMSFDSDAVTIGRRHGRASGRATARARRRGVRREPRPRPGGGADRARGDVGATAPRWRRSRTSAWRRSPGSRSRSRTRRRSTSASSRRSARALGARLIGGCCGTTPAQIAAIRAAVDENRAARHAPRGARARRSSRRRRPRPSRPSSQRLLDAGEFVVSVQLDPPLGGSGAAGSSTPRARCASPASRRSST